MRYNIKKKSIISEINGIKIGDIFVELNYGRVEGFSKENGKWMCYVIDRCGVSSWEVLENGSLGDVYGNEYVKERLE